MGYKIILLGFALLTMSGFKLLSNARWFITESDPTVWVKLCSEMKVATVKDNDLKSDDPLSGTTITGVTALDAVIGDYNNVNSSFLRLAVYPDDPSSPGTPQPGDSVFNSTVSSIRTIEVCFTDPTNPFQAGGAQQKEEGNNIVGCNIGISEDQKDSAIAFLRVLTHEIGHCLGLDHPQETRNAIMSYFSDTSVYKLMIDDKMGLVYLYPKAGVDVKEKATFGLMCSRNE
jgi:hypothetical protein